MPTCRKCGDHFPSTSICRMCDLAWVLRANGWWVTRSKQNFFCYTCCSDTERIILRADIESAQSHVCKACVGLDSKPAGGLAATQHGNGVSPNVQPPIVAYDHSVFHHNGEDDGHKRAADELYVTKFLKEDSAQSVRSSGDPYSRLEDYGVLYQALVFRDYDGMETKKATGENGCVQTLLMPGYLPVR